MPRPASCTHRAPGRLSSFLLDLLPNSTPSPAFTHKCICVCTHTHVASTRLYSGLSVTAAATQNTDVTVSFVDSGSTPTPPVPRDGWGHVHPPLLPPTPCGHGGFP